MRSANLFFKGFKNGMQSFGLTITVIINSVMLFAVYFIGVGMSSLFAKLSGKHFLELKTSKQSDSYWIDSECPKKEKDTHYRQF